MLPGQWGSHAPPRHGHPKQGAEGQWGPAGAGGLDAYPRCMSPFQEGLPALPHCHWFGDTKQTGQEGSCGASPLQVRGSCHPTPQHRGTKHRCRPWQKWNPAGDELCSEPSRVPRPAARCHRRCFAASLREDAAGSAGPPHVASPRWGPWSQPQGHAHGVGAPRRDSWGGVPGPAPQEGLDGCPTAAAAPRGHMARKHQMWLETEWGQSCAPPEWGLKKKEAKLGRCLPKEEERRVRNGSKAVTPEKSGRAARKQHREGAGGEGRPLGLLRGFQESSVRG